MFSLGGTLLHVFAMLLAFGLLFGYAKQKLQSRSKMWMLLSLFLLSALFAVLSVVSPVFAYLSIVIPALFLLYFGGILIVLAIVQGVYSVSWWLFGIVLCCLLALAGSIWMSVVAAR